MQKFLQSILAAKKEELKMYEELDLTQILVLIIAGFAFVTIANFFWKRRNLYKFAKDVPGLPGLPLIGYAHKFIMPDSSEKRCNFLLDIFEKLPEIGAVWFGPKLVYFVTKPEYLEIILNNPNAQNKEIQFYGIVANFLGNGLLTAPANIWKSHRKMLSVAFNKTLLNSFIPAIIQNTNELINKMNQEKNKGNFDMFKHIFNCAYDIVSETMLNTVGSAQKNDENYSNSFLEFFEIITIRVYKFLYHFDFFWRRTRYFPVENNHFRDIQKLAQAIISSNKEKHKTNNNNNNNKSVIEILLEKHKENKLSSQDVEDHTITFLLAGTDTNATAIAFLLLLLALHPEIQKKLHQEITEIVTNNSPINLLEDLPKLKYLQCVIKETLRLFPGGPFPGREITENIKLTEKITIPKNAAVVLGYLPMQRSNVYWKNALKFHPERFMPENSGNQHAYSWLPFSGGSRNCIGIKFGMLTTKIITLLLVKEFKFSTEYKSIEDVELTANIVVHPTNGFKLSYEKR